MHDFQFSKFKGKRLGTEIHVGYFAFQICTHSTYFSNLFDCLGS